jgi:hypothetical protein
MSTPPRPSLLRRLIGRPAREASVDAADMGTAIGMDYVMDQAPAAPSPATKPRRGKTPATGWLGRNRAD